MKYYLSAGNTTPPRLPDEPVLSAPLNLSTKACVSPAPHTPGNIYYISTRYLQYLCNNQMCLL